MFSCFAAGLLSGVERSEKESLEREEGSQAARADVSCEERREGDRPCCTTRRLLGEQLRQKGGGGGGRGARSTTTRGGQGDFM